MAFDENDDGVESPQFTNNFRPRFLARSTGALGSLSLGGAFATSVIEARIPGGG